MDNYTSELWIFTSTGALPAVRFLFAVELFSAWSALSLTALGSREWPGGFWNVSAFWNAVESCPRILGMAA